MKFFGRLTPEEIAAVLNLGADPIQRLEPGEGVAGPRDDDGGTMDTQRWTRFESLLSRCLRNDFVHKDIQFSIRVFFHESHLYQWTSMKRMPQDRGQWRGMRKQYGRC